ncbi:MAG TPA: pilin [Ktedonobacteraceae bacterium]|nr:pilin [Ktedonobacteraceae bacterium]
MKRLLLTVLASLSLAFGLIAVQVPGLVAAADNTAKQQVCDGIGAVSNGDSCTTGGGTLNDIIAVVVNLLSAIIGVIAVIMLIFAGYRYITSGGDSSKVTSAKNTLVYALIGLVVVAMSQFIVKFVIQRATETPKTQTNQQQKAN